MAHDSPSLHGAAKAEAANRAKSLFLAAISHELRTPMNALLGMIELALGEEIPATVRDYLKAAKESADVLLELLNEILDLSRMEIGKFQLDSVPFGLQVVVGQTAKTLGLRAYEKGLELICEVAPDVPDRLVGDPLRLRQILTNLIGNAIKFTQKGEIVVTVHNSEVESVQSPIPPIGTIGHPQPLLRFSVADTGIGIAPEDQDRVFAPFCQAESAATRPQGGTGLGLAISSNLVALMGGRIGVESQPGRGSTFWFTARFQQFESQHPGDKAPVELQNLDAIRGLRALVIDDNAASRQFLERLLDRWGMKVELVGDAPSALKKIHLAKMSGHPYPLVLLDAAMPKTDGLTLVRWLQSDAKAAGAVVLLVSAADRQHGLHHELGRRTVLADKPICPRYLASAIRRALGLGGEEETPPDLSLSAPKAAPARSLRIVVAEDMPLSQKLVVDILTKRGHDVAVAENGAEVIRRIGLEEFDLVLMDVQMPVMNGFQAMGPLRDMEQAGRRRLPVVAMTAHAMKGDAERCLAAGMDGYISKPIKADELVELVERMAAGRAPDVGPADQAQIAKPVSAEATRVGAPHEKQPPATTGAEEVFLLDEALRRSLNRAELFLEMARYFLREGQDMVEEARSARDRGDAPAMTAAAHRLKGTVVYLGAPRATAAAAEVERLGLAGRPEEALAAIDRLQEQVARLGEALAPYVPEEQAV